MKNSIITVYVAMGSNEMDHRSFPVSYHSNHTDAATASKGKGEWGGDGYVSTKKAIVLGTDCYVLEHEVPIDLDGLATKRKEEATKSALAKLTPEEISVLGLDKK